MEEGHAGRTVLKLNMGGRRGSREWDSLDSHKGQSQLMPSISVNMVIPQDEGVDHGTWDSVNVAEGKLDGMGRD